MQDSELRALGEDDSEELEYVPGRFVVNRIIRPRMACSCCDAICQSPLPSRCVRSVIDEPFTSPERVHRTVTIELRQAKNVGFARATPRYPWCQQTIVKTRIRSPFSGVGSST